MKTDIYTKIILTIIAVCLCVIVLRDINFVPKARASEKITAPNINTSYGLVPLNSDGSIDVTIRSIQTNDEMDVNITGVETSEELDINIDEVGGRYVSSGGPILVEIDD